MFLDNSIYLLLIILLGAILVALTINTIKRRKTELELKNQFHFLQTLVDSIASPVFYKDRKGIYQGCNTAFLNMLGRTKEEVVGKTVYDLSPSELAEVYEKADNKLFREGGVQRYETQVKFADGSVHEMFFTKSVFHDSNGELAGLLGVMIDITERKNAEEALERANESLERKVEERTRELQEAERESRAQNDYLNTILDSINHGIIVIDTKDHTIKLANKAARAGKDTAGVRCFEMLHDRGTPCHDEIESCPMNQVRKTGQPTVNIHEHVGPDGLPRHVEIHTFPIFDEDGNVVQIIDNIMDVTSRIMAEKALIDAKEMAESTNQLMSEFIDTVSHELRTPMTSVQGFSKLIQKTFNDQFASVAGEDAKLAKAANRIAGNLAIVISESDRMITLINDQLDLSKLQSGRINWKEDTVSPADLLERTLQVVTPLFADKPLTLESSMEEDLPHICGDPDRLMQVLINLISNAVKFTDEGVVRCTVASGLEAIHFSVSDTGIGIPENELGEIFYKFKQVHNSDAGKPAGTGLGLAISKEIVQHYGGKIWVESETGKGSTFHFTIPLAGQNSIGEGVSGCGSAKVTAD